MQKERIRLIHGSLTYRDKRLAGYDAATVVEVIEHQDPPRLAAFERVLFEFARPQTVVVTTPNVEYNVKFETLAGRQDAPQRSSLRVDTGRIPILGQAASPSDSAIQCASCRSDPKTQPLAAHTDGYFHHPMKLDDSRTRGRRSCRPFGIGQVELCSKAFSAD